MPRDKEIKVGQHFLRNILGKQGESGSKEKGRDREDDDIGGSGVHFSLHMGKHLADLLRNRVNRQWCPSIYEDWRPKFVEDCWGLPCLVSEAVNPHG